MANYRDVGGVPVTIPRKTVPKNVERDWVSTLEIGYDANRYDPDEQNDACLVCGTDLTGHVYRADVEKSCPECERVVMLR